MEKLSEYEEAKKRFKSLTKRGGEEEVESQKLDELVREFCEGKSFDVFDGNTFYDLIFHADFIQIKDKIKSKFYKTLCEAFLFNKVFNEIITATSKLNDIPHVKLELFNQICKNLGIYPVYNGDNLILTHEQNISQSCDGTVKKIIIEPIAFKVWSCRKEKFKLAHLNFIFKLFDDIEEIVLSKCNLNGRDVENLLIGFKLKKLNLSACGTIVNEIIRIHLTSESFQNLEELNISNNPIHDTTLEKIRCIPLKTLNISNCLMKNGKMFNNIWVSDCIKVTKSIDAKSNIDVLWSQGALRESLKVLNVSDCTLTNENLTKLSYLNLEQLDIEKCLMESKNFQLSFSSGLSVLKMKNQWINHEHLKTISNLNFLKTLEFHYRIKPEDDFTKFEQESLFKNLTELSVTISDVSVNFLHFISKLMLEKIEFKTDDTDECPIEILFKYPEQRANLQTLFLSFPCMEVNDEFIRGISKLKLLKTFSISLAESFNTFSDILSCENIQKSVVTLNLLEKEIENGDLIELMKFDNLEEISFIFTNNLNESLLNDFVNKKSLKKFNLSAEVHGQFDLELAKLMCTAPVRKMNVYDDYNGGISDEAFQHLSNPINSSKFMKNLKELYLRAKLQENFANILGSIRWEKIFLDNCVVEGEAFGMMFNNENLHFSLDHLSIIDTSDLEIILKALTNKHLSIFELQLPTINKKEFFNHLLSGCISKSLRILTVELCNVPIDMFAATNLSVIDNFLETSFF